MAFLINAYNGFTVELILTKYPDLKSIRDFGKILVNSPWKKKFFTLFGRESYLDEIEHGILRKPGAYDEPRVHYAVNCASVGCPMLREEAFVATRLDAQLEEQARRFLSDRSRNRFDPAAGRLEVSRDLQVVQGGLDLGLPGHRRRGTGGVARAVLRPLCGLLAERPEHRALVASGRAPIDHLDYDWSLNDAR